ncbi:MAG: cytochrome c biogenesis CcdA family protein [Acidimicrobiia bacterium]|nr:cytochrome c biogenesis CcdA family protein [Acidimicrobiia bacterium]
MIDWDLASFALGAGLIAAFNPCGFAMLPAYLAYFLGLESDGDGDASHNVLRGLAVGLTLTAGFVTFFTVIGILTQTVVDAGTIEQRIPYATVGFGVLLVPLGVAMLKGYEPKLRLPSMNRGTGSRELPSIFAFGISYAVVSLSCTAPIFFGTVIGSFTSRGTVDGVSVFVAYALGMSLVVMVLTLAMAVGRSSVAANMRRVLPYVNRVSGGLLVVAGIYLTLYGWWEIKVLDDPTESNWLVDRSLDAQNRVQNWVVDSGETRLALAAAFIIGTSLLWALRSNFTTNARWLAFGAVAASYMTFEFSYGADLAILPTIRTVADAPGRVANWFAHPGRWPVVFEIMAAALLGVLVFFSARGRLQHVRSDHDTG